MASAIKTTSVTNGRSPERPPKIITQTHRNATCNAPVLARMHLESPRRPSLGRHGASQDLPYDADLRILMFRMVASKKLLIGGSPFTV